MQGLELFSDATLLSLKECHSIEFDQKPEIPQNFQDIGIGSLVLRLKNSDNTLPCKKTIFKSSAIYFAENSFEAEVKITTLALRHLIKEILPELSREHSLNPNNLDLEWICDIPYMIHEIEKTEDKQKHCIQELKEILDSFSSKETKLPQTSREKYFHHLCHRTCRKLRESLKSNTDSLDEGTLFYCELPR